MADENTTPTNEGQNAEKTFTQAELDAIVERRLARERKGMPDEAELTAFRAWKDSQQTEKDRVNALTKERDTANETANAATAKAEQLAREIVLYKRGITDAEDIEYYAYRIGKLVTKDKDFAKAAEEYFKENQPRGTVRIDMGGSLQGGGSAKTGNDLMNDLIRKAGK